ncbi:MAG: hypothetical protein ACRCZD_12730 [Phycicoccus sp.]
MKNPEDLLNSLTGFDELAIKSAFGMTIGQLAEDESRLLRACYFTESRREGFGDAPAYAKAMEITLGELTVLYSAPTDAEGEAPAGTTPGTRPDGVSAPADPSTSIEPSPVWNVKSSSEK